MALQDISRRAGPFAWASNRTYSFGFKVFATDQVAVTVLRGEVESTLSSSQYTVTLNADQENQPGGKVVLASGVATASRVVITSAVPYTQEMVLTNQGGFYPDIMNENDDRIVAQIQQLREGLDRAIKVGPTSSKSAAEYKADLEDVVNTAAEQAAAAAASAADSADSASDSAAAAAAAQAAAEDADEAASDAKDAAVAAKAALDTAVASIPGIVTSEVDGRDIPGQVAAAVTAQDIPGQVEDKVDAKLTQATIEGLVELLGYTPANDADLSAEVTARQESDTALQNNIDQKADDSAVVKHTVQTLTDAQKEQARTNIDAFSVNDGITATGSTTARTLASRFADVVNVKDFGAKGDGTTDDAAAFTAAANSKGTSNPIQVYIPPGTYLLNSDPIQPAQYSNAARKIYWYVDAAASFAGSGKLCNYPIYMGEYPNWYGNDFLPNAAPNRTGSIPNSMRVIQTDNNPITRTALTLCTKTDQGLVNSDYAGFQSLLVNNNTTTRSRSWSGYFESSRTTDSAGGTLGIEIAMADASPSGSSDTSPYGQLTTSDGASVDPYHASICLWMGGGGELEGLTQNDITAFIGTANGCSKAKLGIVIGDNSIVTDSDGYANAMALPSGYGIRWWSDKTTKTAGIRCDVTTGIALEQIFANNLTRFAFRNASNALVSAFQINHSSRNAVSGLLLTPAGAEGPVLEPTSSSTNVDIRLRGKGTGLVRYGTYTAGVLTPTGYITIKDIGGTQRRLLVG